MSVKRQELDLELRSIKTYLALHGKRYILFIFLFMILDLLRVRLQGGDEAGLLAAILSLIFIYKVNVEEKVGLTWNYFHSLPLNIYSKILIKMILPFLLIVFYAMAYSFPQIDNFMQNEWPHVILDYSILIVASVLARTFVGLIGYFILGNILVNLTEEFYYFPLLTLALIWAYGLYHFSGKRFTLKGLVVFLIIPSILLNLTWFLISGGGANFGSGAEKRKGFFHRDEEGMDFNIYLKNKI